MMCAVDHNSIPLLEDEQWENQDGKKIFQAGEYKGGGTVRRKDMQPRKSAILVKK
jgi:hypothetical protein